MSQLPWNMSVELLVVFVLKSTVLAAIAWLVLWQTPRVSPIHRNLVARFGIGGLLLLPLLMMVLPDWTLALPRQSRAVDLAFTLIAPGSISTSAAGESTAGTNIWPAAALLVWAIGAAVAGLRTVAGWIAARSIVHASQPVDGDGALDDLGAALDRVRVRRPVQLVFSDRITVPFTAGLFHPVIAVPAHFAALEHEQCRQILLHEAAHVKRSDVLWMLLAELAVALYWFNPLVRLLRRDLTLEAEKACDDLVLLAGCDRQTYAQYLLDATRLVQRRQVVRPLGAEVARHSFIEGRIMSILSTHTRRPRAAGLVILTTAMMFLIVLPVLAGLHLTPAEVLVAPTVATTSGSDKTDEALPAEDDFVPVDEYPEMIHQEVPVYPEKAKADSIEGTVWVKALVDSTGSVRTAKVGKSSGVPMLDSAAVSAAAKCRYRPGISKGRPVAVWVTYKLVFTLDGKKD